MIQRPRRLRQNPVLRQMLQEVHLRPENLIYPLFIKEGISEKQAISSMPGIFQYSLKEAVAEIKLLQKDGLKSVILFGIPEKKDNKASEAINPKGIIQKACQEIKSACPTIFLITDVCLCEYMDHGHCGLLHSSGTILNDPSLEILAQSALSHAMAGADMVAPSDMMDGRVAAIRQVLDESSFADLPIMSYAVKYASHFYGPFREAAESAPLSGDRKSYQMDFKNIKEASREAFLDEEEGADILMVKPALPYLDILKNLSEQSDLPLAAYQVSGEYTMLRSAVDQGWLNEDSILESLISTKRAGAQLILTYFAKDILSKL